MGALAAGWAQLDCLLQLVPCRQRRCHPPFLLLCILCSSSAEDSARQHAEGFVDAAHKLVALIEKLYAGVEMPRSDFSMSSLFSK